ncbi:MAG: 2-keto-3-deoxygluconate permease [Lachnospiraceae bacterium]|nr:2-keto-3-deoxygluconate permease [Lachnospiraceae bacterium]
MILKVLKKVPAGLMIIPMFIGIIIHTFCPGVLEIGSFTTATFSNTAAATFMGMQLLCLGSQMQLKGLRAAVKRGGVLLMSKVLLGVGFALIIGKIGGHAGIFQISLLAFICAITNINGSIYLSLVTTYGDEADGATVAILSLSNGPLLTLIVLGMSGFANFSFISLIAVIVPIGLGLLLGNINEELKLFLRPGVQLLLPFIGFTLGAGIDLKDVLLAGSKGIMLSVIVIVVGGSFTYLCDRWLAKRPGYAGLATCATGANAIGVPAAVALVDRSWEPYVASAATQIAAAVVIGAIVIPFVVGIFIKRKRG